MQAHRVLVPWSASSTWDSLGSGVSLNNVEAESVSMFNALGEEPNVWTIFDATRAVQAWAANPSVNQGVLIYPQGTDGWRCLSSDNAAASQRPLLSISYVITPCELADFNASGSSDSDDLFDFLDLWFAQSGLSAPPVLGADFNSNNVVDSDDVFAFLDAWFAPCP
jgi:hypothetical protein